MLPLRTPPNDVGINRNISFRSVSGKEVLAVAPSESATVIVMVV
jgi:hypothetical protein